MTLPNKIRRLAIQMRMGLPISEEHFSTPGNPQVAVWLEAARHAKDPSAAMTQLGTFLEESDRLSRRVRLALLYPRLLLASLLIQCILMWGLIYPSILSSIAGLWLSPPWLLRLGVTPLPLIIGLVLATLIYSRVTRRITRFPGLRRLRHLAEQALWCRGLAHVVRAGMALGGTPSALKSVAAVLTEESLKREAAQLDQRVAAGSQLSEALGGGEFDPLVQWAAQSGETRNDLPSALDEVAQELEFEVSQQSEVYLRWLQPISILVMGLFSLIPMVTFWLPYYWLSVRLGQ